MKINEFKTTLDCKLYMIYANFRIIDTLKPHNSYANVLQLLTTLPHKWCNVICIWSETGSNLCYENISHQGRKYLFCHYILFKILALIDMLFNNVHNRQKASIYISWDKTFWAPKMTWIRFWFFVSFSGFIICTYSFLYTGNRAYA